jgi:hypothetical protein
MLGFAGLIETAVRRLISGHRSLLGVPPSTLLLSFVTFTSAPLTVGAERAGTSVIPQRTTR